MKKILIITLLILLPLSAFALEAMEDNELSQVTGRFGTSAASDAGALAAPVGDVSSNAGNISPVAEPAAMGVNAIVEGGYYNDKVDDTTRMTTYFVNTVNIVRMPTFGFF